MTKTQRTLSPREPTVEEEGLQPFRRLDGGLGEATLPPVEEDGFSHLTIAFKAQLAVPSYVPYGRGGLRPPLRVRHLLPQQLRC